jgi:ABC-type polysaccharide/polyol phosphate transport system ATPase subunit
MYAIDLENVTKSFKRATKKGAYTTLKTELLSWWQSDRKESSVADVLKSLTLKVPQGASLGVIGRNGSGKSTLLKLITGIYKPDAGIVRVNGRVSALIELGAGFHPDFTGRENVFLAGVMQGMTKKEVKEKFEDIVKFSELEDVIDDPVRTYSSGMFMRLGFSVAIHADPDVLLVDEVLAVGDAGFVAKCKDRITQLKREGKTLILVAHDLDSIERWSDQVIWIDKGEVKDRGEPRRVIDAYRTFIEKGEEARVVAPPLEESPRRWGSKEIEIENVLLLDREGEPKKLFHPNEPLKLVIEYKKNVDVPKDVVFGVGFERSDGILAFGTNTHISRTSVPELSQRGSVCFEISRLGFLDGSFKIDVAVHREDGYPYDYFKGAVEFLVRSPFDGVGVASPEHSWSFS